MKIYVGNLDERATESDLRELLAPFGEIVALEVKRHHRSDDPLRFALVVMADEESGRKAIDGLNNTTFRGRPLSVMKAFVRPDLPEIPENGA